MSANTDHVTVSVRRVIVVEYIYELLDQNRDEIVAYEKTDAGDDPGAWLENIESEQVTVKFSDEDVAR